MKKDKKTASTKQTRSPQFGRLTLLAGALVAAGVLSPLLMPEAMAASPLHPLPMPCGGCGNFASTGKPITFLQSGELYSVDKYTNQVIIDPKTGLPVPVANGQNLNLIINQKSQNATFNWQTFDVASGNSVTFEQPNSTSIALNRVWDPLLNPSIIAGKINADGQVYLINRNGIVFANGAQVNTSALIASSLDFNDQNTVDGYGYLTNTLVLPAFSGNSGFIKVETGAVLNGSRIMLFAPVVENSGQINTPDGQAVLAAGNRVYLEASTDPNLRGVLVEVDVDNPGAGNNAALAYNKSVGNQLVDDKDPALGYKKLQNTAEGTVTNAGRVSKVVGVKLDGIFAERGNITLVGYAVNQQGMLNATTSVTENGSIKLLARYNVAAQSNATRNAALSNKNGTDTYDIRAQQTGKVILAAGSVTQVTPDLADTSTTTDGQGFKQSIVEVMGKTIEMEKGSSIVAHGGKVTLAAMSKIDTSAGGLGHVYQEIFDKNAYSSFLNPNYKPVADSSGARVLLDSGSSIDVSGITADVSVARNILTVQLRGSQLADAPVQRNGYLWGKNVLIDMRTGSTLANYSGEEAQVGRTVAERTTTGGSVNLVSTGDVVMQSGSKVNLSGGQLNYTGAYINTSTLISNGVAYDIATASPDRIYNGISGTFSVSSKKWGVSETFNTMAGGDMRGRWDPGYVEGKSAGTLTVLAPTAVVNGDIVATTVKGKYQRQAYVDPTTLATNNYMNTWQMLPKGGTLVIGDNTPVTLNGITNYVTDSNVVIQTGATQLPSNFVAFDQAGNANALPTDFQNNIYLDTRLFDTDTGLNRLEVYSNNAVEVASGTTVKLAAGGAITLKGNTVSMKGAIDAPAGSVKLATVVTTKSTGGKAGTLCVGASTCDPTLTASAASYIVTRGQWVNDALQTAGIADLSKPLLTNGGSINLSSGADLLVAAGTLLDASGGAWLDASNKLHGGNGGAITLASGSTPPSSGIPIPYKARVDGLDLRSYGTAGGKGGALTIKAADIDLGGTKTKSDKQLVLAPEFFQRGGFSSYTLTAQGANGLNVNTVIEPKAQSLILDQTAFRQASGSDVTTFAQVGQLPDWQRAPASITLGATIGDLNVAEGAVIKVEPTAEISLFATNHLTVLGTLDAAAGGISLSLNGPDQVYDASNSIWLGSQSKLLSQGSFLQSAPNAQNLTQGQVLNGGKISISANGGMVVAQKGSLMDVSGTSANIDLPQLASGSLVYRRSHVSGNAGSVAIQTDGGGFLDGTMKAGVEAGSQAAAGSFSLTLNNNPGVPDLLNQGSFPRNPAQIQVMASGNGSFATNQAKLTVSDADAVHANLTAIAGKFWLDANALQKSGFDQVKLKSENQIVLNQVDLQTRRSITLDAPVLVSNGPSNVTSAQVTIGNLGINQTLLDAKNSTNYTPDSGSGVLTIKGQMVDLTGNFIVSGVNQVNITASNDNSSNPISSNDIRLNGSINSGLIGSMTTQGNVTLTADQVYPTTMSQFTLSVETKDPTDSTGKSFIPTGMIKVLPGQHGPSPVMSAGGMLKLSAADIEQYGVVKAPLGTIDLNATQKLTLGDPDHLENKSLTSVSADGLIIPFGEISGGNTWLYDPTGSTGTLSDATIAADTKLAPPPKLVKLTAPSIKVQSNATVNLSGGGDLYANEFFAGSGGSVNVLDPSKAPANTYAIIPGISGFAPYDPQLAGQYAQAGSKTTLQAGASVYLAGGNGLAAGYYTLLPAGYALLPGAFRVTAVSGYTDMQPGQGATTLLNGSQVMAGKFAVVGTNIQDARYSGFMVTPGALVRTQSEYHDSYANAFFAAQAATSGSLAPKSPIDAGRFIVDATGTTLVLAGTINTQHAAGGRGAWVDLNSASGFDIVNAAGSGTAGGVELTTSVLNALGAESLMIGGTRDQTTNVTTVGTGFVTVENKGAILSGAEIILAAKDAVTVKAGSDVEGKGTFSGQASNINIGNFQVTDSKGKVTQQAVNGDGALLRVSSAAQVTVARTNLAGKAAKLTVEDGAIVGAQNAVLLDSSRTTTVGNSAVLKGTALSVAAQIIDIGTNPSAATSNSLALSGDLLARALTFKDLTLHSYNDINFYGAAALGGTDATTGNHLITNLTLNAVNLNGINNAGQTNIIDADNVTLMNNNSGTSAAPAYGGGNLTIKADQIALAAGDKSIRGFDTVKFAAKKIVAQGTSSVTITSGEVVPTVHSLVLQAGQITGENNSDLTITASNDNISILLPVTGATATAGESLNAKLKIEGKRIDDSGVINLAAGSVTLHATGADAAKDGVTLLDGSKTIANGVSKTISGQTVYAQAGTVSLIAENGGVDIQKGSVVDVSGAADANGGSDAGSINIAATKGAATVAGSLKGSADAKHAKGSFTLDAKSLALNHNSPTNNALTDLNNTLTAGSFTTLRDMRIRTDDLKLDADVPGTAARATAQTFRLTADAGSIDVLGTVDASGSNGGTILLAANNDLTLESGALLDAHATGAGQAGGKVTLETTKGTIELNNQLIDVHGDGNTGGNVLLRAPQIKTYTDVAVNNTGGSRLNISRNANVTVEAFRTYVDDVPVDTTTGDRTLTDATKYYNDAQSFANAAAAAGKGKSRLGMLDDPNNPNMHLVAGVELDSTSNLTLGTNLDLSTWRFNDGKGNQTEAGILTLRAAGNLQFGTVAADGTVTTASLTDGFTQPADINNYNQIIDVGGYTGYADPINYVNPITRVPGSSSSYRLVAGADLTSADVMAVNTLKKGNVVLVKGAESNSGYLNGIDTYTMEQVRTGNGFIDVAAGGNFILGNRDSVIYTGGSAIAMDQDGYPVIPAIAGTSNFGANSGDINIRVKGDVIGAVSDQLVTDWQWRQGNVIDGTKSAWWINIGSFRQGIGALGGGNVSVTAEGNINNLSASTPTTGYVDATGNTVVLGGGNLSVTAGGDINSGVFYVGNGQGTIRAGGKLGIGTGLVGLSTTKQTLYGTLLAMDHGSFDVRTGGDLVLQTVFNPTVLTQGYTQLGSGITRSNFFTYGDFDGVSLSSLGGNVTLGNANSLFQSSKNNAPGFFYLDPSDAVSVYPGSLQVSALSGSIISNGYSLFPSTTGQLKFVASQDILLSGQLLMSDASPADLLANAPSTGYSALAAILRSGHSSIHASDAQSVIMSAGGSITGNINVITSLVLPESAQLVAGQDVKYFNLTAQNLNSQDTTSIVAGRDISTFSASVAGPGQVVLQAGRNVDLGVTDGLTTTGNLTNLLLPEQGASITVLAGVGQGTTDTQAFIGKYINPAASTDFSTDLIAYVDKYDGVVQGQTAAQAFTAFGSLSKPLQDAFVRQVFFSELKQTGRSAVSTGNYQSGYDAIATLFPPSTGYKGDISLYSSQIKTERGGDINLLTPGGGVNAGLAIASAKKASELGIVTVKGGDVNAFVNNDFMVNQSRVFTLQGGNILMWSSLGNIDAGKGSKTVSSTPPPLLVVDPATGTFTVDLTGSIVGSGIRVLLANKDVVPGSVDLYAPSGEINAGDAGIGAAGNIFLGALVVRGADNINFGGTSAGVPVAAPAPVSVGLGNLQDASKAADQATSSLANMKDMNANDFKPSFLSVEVIGLGDQGCGEDDQSARCKQANRSSD